MSDLIAIVYPSEAKAEDVRQRLLKMQTEYLIKISDAVIAVKTEDGPVKLNQLVNTTAMGAAFLAGLGVGYWKRGDEIKKIRKVDKVFSHKMNEKLPADEPPQT